MSAACRSINLFADVVSSALKSLCAHRMHDYGEVAFTMRL
jgi:hypothetical protein